MGSACQARPAGIVPATRRGHARTRAMEHWALQRRLTQAVDGWPDLEWPFRRAEAGHRNAV